MSSPDPLSPQIDTEELQQQPGGFLDVKDRDLQEAIDSQSHNPGQEEEHLFDFKDMTPEAIQHIETAWHHLSDPSKPLSHRHRELVRLLAKGLPYLRIHELLGYSRPYISVLACHEKIRREVSKLQDKQFEMGINDRFQSLNHSALDRIEEMISSEDREIKLKDRVETAKWLLEKTTGKAKQEIETKDGNLTDFMTLLRQVKEEQNKNGEGVARPALETSEGQTFIDVTPARKEEDALASWVEQNT